ncbi:FAD-binding protein [Microbacterium gorillae]|uniref:FAD-binding protein n=1 Tax=Microbacterium gorillae TaxID=1231063 RepID=UPI00069338BD|nr:FAD-binding protein [Microbacterium gorillae]
MPPTSASASSSRPASAYDVVVVGSGAAAFATALGAIDEGLSVLMVESTDRFGGNSAMSGGGLWLPNNPLMRRDGARDSRDEALAYLEETVGEPGLASSPARKEAFVDGIADFVATSERYGFRWARAANYPDYYPELPGGKIGRSIEVEPIDSKLIGEWRKKSRALLPFPMMNSDMYRLGRAWSTWSGFFQGVRLVFRTLGGLVRGKILVGMGAGLITSFTKAVVVDGGVPLLLNTPARRLLVEDERVVGVEIEVDGAPQEVRARRGVMLAAGGFDQDKARRKELQGVEGFPAGSPGALGGGIDMAAEVGAALEYMEDAWWGATVRPVEGGLSSFIVGERSMPYSLIVDKDGRRFANESESYVDLGHHMLEHDGATGPYWMILDGRYTKRYFLTFAVDPKANRKMVAEGIKVTAPTLAELGAKIGVDAGVFAAEIEKFNGFARSGRDQDFHRGDSAYDRYYGDPTNQPNNNLAPIEKGTFTAYEIVIGDLGTKGGVVSDVHGRALRADGSVIEGLYSAGNNSAAVMGHTYPGPGSTIGPACVFGLLAARHMAGSSE